MAEQQVRLSDEELNQLKATEQGYHALTKEYGELEYQKALLNSRLEELKKLFFDLEQERTTLMNSLTEKYGNGQVDINTGEFRPE